MRQNAWMGGGVVRFAMLAKNNGLRGSVSIGVLPRGAEGCGGVPRGPGGDDEASPRGWAEPYSGTPVDALKR